MGAASRSVREAACRGYTRRQTRFPRSPARRPARTRARLNRSPHRRFVVTARLEVGEEVERAGHEHRLAERVGERERGARGRRTPRRRRTTAARARRAPPPGARADSTSGVATNASPDAGERREHRVDVLVARESTPSPCSPPPGAARRATGRRRGCARRRGPRSPRRSSRPGSATPTAADASTGLPRNALAAAAASAVEPPVSTTTSPRPLPGRAAPTRARRARPCSRGGSPRASRAAIASRVDAEHVRVLERDVREHDDARRVERRSSRRAGRRARPRPPRPRPRAARNATNAAARQRLELGRLEPLGGGPHPASAASRSASAPSTRIRSAHDRDVRREVRARRAGPSRAEELLDHPRRRRLAVRPDDVHGGQAALRLAERGEQRAHPLEPEAVARPGRERLEPGDVASRGLRAEERRARAGTARASRAPPSTTSAGAFATNRSFASIPSARAISFASRVPLGLDVAGRLRAARAGRRPRRCAAPRPCRARPGRRCGGRPAPPPARGRARRPSPAYAASGSGHGETISRASRPGRCDQISSVTCGMSGWRSASSRLERGERRRAASSSPS